MMQGFGFRSPVKPPVSGCYASTEPMPLNGPCHPPGVLDTVNVFRSTLLSLRPSAMSTRGFVPLLSVLSVLSALSIFSVSVLALSGGAAFADSPEEREVKAQAARARAQHYEDLSLFTSVLELVRGNYVEDVDEHALLMSAMRERACHGGSKMRIKAHTGAC